MGINDDIIPKENFGESSQIFEAVRELNFNQPQKVTVDNIDESLQFGELITVSKFTKDINANHTETGNIIDCYDGNKATQYQIGQGGAVPSANTSTVTFDLGELKAINNVYLMYSINPTSVGTTTTLKLELSNDDDAYNELINESVSNPNVTTQAEYTSGEVIGRYLKVTFTHSPNSAGNIQLHIFSVIGKKQE